MSQLISIIQRLQTMQNAEEHEEVQQRLFEVNGKTLCQVKYFPASGTFEVEEYDKDNNKQKYQFDDIDIAAIEIFDIVQEEKNPS
ncbi:YkuJ family protein [Lederbergia citrea]|uniref:YkuJ family protein n=1 Tax=Lederbergia citrea TaxID=2833581 RepID=A0A942UKL9_9BACI|nr:YkuJ family protein [Lederbergia citrea]MBS4177301.1 YkuJ family protein [Lederbergia citrea]MBS4203964.1 YkuJ family protein [Lederbergia citrea]MBS4221452.1 YkuJ family protein [Lederbergia citrea]